MVQTSHCGPASICALKSVLNTAAVGRVPPLPNTSRDLSVCSESEPTALQDQAGVPGSWILPMLTPRATSLAFVVLVSIAGTVRPQDLALHLPGVPASCRSPHLITALCCLPVYMAPPVTHSSLTLVFSVALTQMYVYTKYITLLFAFLRLFILFFTFLVHRCLSTPEVSTFLEDRHRPLVTVGR